MSTNLQIIEQTVEDFVNAEVSFTSVDIANKIKGLGVWIRNREVAEELKSLFAVKYPDYVTSTIKVKRAEDSNDVSATLYHLKTKSSDDYKNLSGAPLKPEDFNKTNRINKKFIFLTIEDKKELLKSTIVKKDSKATKKNDKDNPKKENKLENDKEEKEESKTQNKGFSKKGKRNYTKFNFV